MKLRFDIALKGKNERLAGETDFPDALCTLLQAGGALKNSMGYVYTDLIPDAKLCIAASEGCGVYLGITANGTESLSLHDAEALAECTEISGDDGEKPVSRGLFLPPAEALRAIRCFAKTGLPLPEMNWITPEELPEEGAYII